MPQSEREGKTGWVWPVKTTRISGYRFDPRSHPGVDIGAPSGSQVWSPARGTVTYAGWSNSGYGNLVVVTTAGGYKFYLAHLSEILVKVGESVSAGKLVALSGSTGRSSGPHLHFEVRGPSGFLDPLKLSWGSSRDQPYKPGDGKSGETGLDGTASGEASGKVRVQSPFGEFTISDPFAGLKEYIQSIKWINVAAFAAGFTLIIIGVYGITQGELKEATGEAIKTAISAAL